MEECTEPMLDQSRWNSLGKVRIREMEADRDKFTISTCPISHLAAHGKLINLLTPMQNKNILELGCGRGELSIWLAKQGAQITAIDIGPDLVTAAKGLADLNQVKCTFMQGDITDLPVGSAAFDAVIGIAILHHLSEASVPKVLRECHRVLNAGGFAIFHEPVENSRLFDCMQNLVPVGRKGKKYYRPSILQRKAWKHHVRLRDDRAMTNRELISAGEGVFSTITILPYGLLIRLVRLFGNKPRRVLRQIDAWLFKLLPPLRRFSQTVLVVYNKKA
jgi:2-polyprenyl-3-methyl-5-hydroxy-6-metoxy-1,4-benzoquinol methylase